MDDKHVAELARDAMRSRVGGDEVGGMNVARVVVIAALFLIAFGFMAGWIAKGAIW